MSFAYSTLRIYDTPIDTELSAIAPLITLPLPQNVDNVTFLDEETVNSEDEEFRTRLRWVARLAGSKTVLFTLTCTTHASSSPYFEFTKGSDTYIRRGAQAPKYSFSVADSIGNTGGHMVLLSTFIKDYNKAPGYTIAPLRAQNAPLRDSSDWDRAIVTGADPVEIPKEGLPLSSLVTCLDFDDGHGLLLIGSGTGQFCILNFANAILPDNAFVGGLPITSPHVSALEVAVCIE